MKEVELLENFIAALTPGGIEAQEARGQREAVASERLPRAGTENRAAWEAMGFEFMDDHDGLFVNVRFPKGWKLIPSDHSMWSYLHDDKGRKRGSMFYKAAFYDRSAHIRLNTRYRYGADYDHGTGPRNEQEYAVVVWDGNAVIHTAGKLRHIDWKNMSKTEVRKIGAMNDADDAAAKAWLQQNYPKYQDTSAYWD